MAKPAARGRSGGSERSEES